MPLAVWCCRTPAVCLLTPACSTSPSSLLPSPFPSSPRPQHDTALRLLSVMKQEGVQPNCITFNTVLHSAARSDVAWDSLVSIFAQMRKDGVQVRKEWGLGDE